MQCKVHIQSNQARGLESDFASFSINFTDNPKLFASYCPCPPAAILKIPGPTFPVTVHYNKIMVFDEKEYQEAAFAKVCKIHSKLLASGILVFLTGKQEIVQMVK